MSILLTGALWVHLTACVLLTGAFSLLLLAGGPPAGAMAGWEKRLLAAARWLVLVALAGGLVWFAARTATFENRPGAAFEPNAIVRAALGTWPGIVWLARQSLLVLLAAFLWCGEQTPTRADWLASRGQAFLLALLALVLLSSSGHSAAVSDRLWPQLTDMVHLAAAGFWVGGLPWLALLLHTTSRGGSTPDQYAVRAMNRFSHVALVAVLALAISGSVTGLLLVQGIPGLIGTQHGHFLLAKLAVLVPALLLAWVSRVLMPRLSESACRKPSDVARRMAWFIGLEAALVLLLLAFAAAMVVTTPARHGEPVWPIGFRLSPEMIASFKVVPTEWFWAAALLVSALVAFVVLLRKRRRMFAGGLLAVAFSGIACLIVSPLIVEAFPSSYARAPVTFHAGSIARGRMLYEEYCAACHSVSGGMDSSIARDLVIAERARSAGELFWLSAHPSGELAGIASEGGLEEMQRWHVVNYLRAQSTAWDPRPIGTEVEPENGWLAAPDFTISMGPLTHQALRDFRGRRMVLLVLYTLPESQGRMAELARRYGALSVLGVEVVAVAPTASSENIAALGGPPPVMFPVITAGNEDIRRTYELFARGASHVEFLIDRQGYIRAMWRDDQTGMPDAAAVQAAVEQLIAEKAPPPLPDDHIH